MATSNIKQVINNSGSGYCKMPDGTLICYGKASAEVQGHTRVDMNVQYPHAFISAPSVTANTIIYSITADGKQTTNYNIRWTGTDNFGILLGNTTDNDGTISFSWIAIGRWK